MNNTDQVNKIINTIIQKTNKKHNTCDISVRKKQEIYFLNYLCYNKIIYGYTLKSDKKYTLYLKYRQSGNIIKYNNYKKIENYKTLRKHKQWLKNNFFIINTTKGFANIKETVSFKIGGFVLYTIS